MRRTCYRLRSVEPSRQAGSTLRWLVVCDPAGGFRPQAFLSTDPDILPADMLTWFIRRWSIEVTFAEVRRHLGVETQRQWTDRAIARTTPMLLALKRWRLGLSPSMSGKREMPCRWRHRCSADRVR